MNEPKRKSKRRGNGEGSIFQRADGRWVATLAAGYNDAGKRKRTTVYGNTKAEVQSKLLELQQRKSLGAVPGSRGGTVSEYLHRWLDDVCRVTVRESTYNRYKELMRVHVYPRVGGVRLTRLTAADIQHLYAEMEKAGKSPRTRRFTHAVLRKALSQAVEWGFVPTNVCTIAKAPKASKPEMLTLSAVEAENFLSAAKSDRLYAMYVLALTTGMRQGELFALQWADIDLNTGALSVRRTVTARTKVDEPKTAKGKRRIELPEMAVEALQEHRKAMLVEGLAGSQWVFPDTHGGLLSCHNVSYRSFKPIVKAADVPKIRFHDLRHTAATLMLSQGVHPKVVQEMLGHSTIAITMDTYSHVLPSMQREAADKMNRLLKAKTG